MFRVDMQWDGIVPSLYAGMATGVLLGSVIGGPYHVFLGMSTLGGLAALGEGGVALYNRWYAKKREQVFRQRLLEKRRTLLQQRERVAESDNQQLEQIDQQLNAIAYHLQAQEDKQEIDHEHTRSWMALKVPRWFPIQPVTEQTLQRKREEEALERELLKRYHAERELEYGRTLASQNAAAFPPSEQKEEASA